MSNVNNLTSKILKDAEERKESILAMLKKKKIKFLLKKKLMLKNLKKKY